MGVNRVAIRKDKRGVMLALVLPSLAGIYHYGASAILVILISVASAQLTEMVILRIRRRELQLRGGALITGLLIALILPPTIPLWAPAITSMVAIALGKQAFGGSGRNLFNPAVVGILFLVALWPQLLGGYGFLHRKAGIDAITGATPLAAKSSPPSWGDLLWGRIGGSIGETSSLCLILGGAYLIGKRYVPWVIPLSLFGTLASVALIYGEDPQVHLFSGGLLMAAFLMATDYVTTPSTMEGRIVFGIWTGFLIMLIRLFSIPSEGVVYSLLIMNGVTPFIERFPKREKPFLSR